MASDAPTCLDNEVSDNKQSDNQGWQARPGLAGLLRWLVILVPVVLSVTTSIGLARLVPPWKLGMDRWVWWIGAAAVSTVVLIVSDRTMRRLLPLSTLLKLTLVFPDETPSRFGVAMRTGTTKQLERRVAQSRSDGKASAELDRASLMLEMVAALGLHDRLTRGHCERVRAYTDLVIDELDIPSRDASLLRWAALLHDVGKLRVPREILSSSGRPSEEEWVLLKTHPDEGMALTDPLADWLGDWRRTVGEHHERWDGGGYPNGLAARDIHLGARIVAVTDAFDVMTSARSYKRPIPARAAREEIARCSGTQFDPLVVRAFLNVGVRKLRLVLGPLAWFSNLPAIGQAPIAAAASQGVSAIGVAALITLAAATGVADAGLPPAVRALPAPVEVRTGAPTTSTTPEITVFGDPHPGATSSRTSSTTPVTETTSKVSPTTTSPGSASTPTSMPASTSTTATPRSPSTKPPIAVTTTTSPVLTPTSGSPITPAATAATTTAVATSPATTTTVPPSTAPAALTGVVLYFAESGASATESSLASGPGAATNPEPDSSIDNDGKPGLTIKSSGNGTSTDPREFHDWVWTPSTPTTLNGTVDLQLFSTAHNFHSGQRVRLDTSLLLCDTTGANCTVLLQRSWQIEDWNGGVDDWAEGNFTLGTLSGVVVQPGRQIRLHLEAGDHDLWIAMSGDRPTSLHLTVS
jgi:hypothetical protein